MNKQKKYRRFNHKLNIRKSASAILSVALMVMLVGLMSLSFNINCVSAAKESGTPVFMAPFAVSGCYMERTLRGKDKQLYLTPAQFRISRVWLHVYTDDSIYSSNRGYIHNLLAEIYQPREATAAVKDKAAEKYQQLIENLKDENVQKKKAIAGKTYFTLLSQSTVNTLLDNGILNDLKDLLKTVKKNEQGEREIIFPLFGTSPDVKNVCEASTGPPDCAQVPILGFVSATTDGNKIENMKIIHKYATLSE